MTTGAGTSANHLFIGAVCVIVRRGDRVLAMRRARTKDAAPGVWEAISGRLEPGEPPIEAACREVLEESGLQVRVDERPLEAHATERAGVPMLIVYYVAEWIAGEPVLSEEHDEFRWANAEGFAAISSIVPLVQAVRRVLEAG